MGRGLTKAERLQEMIWLYLQRGYSDIKMADRLGVDRTTVYRDRTELEGEHVFIQETGGRYRLDRMQYMSNIKVNLHEALALYLAARRASRQTRIAQPHAAGALEKLAIALKQPMTERLVRSAGNIFAQQADPGRVKVLEAITQGWAENRKVWISYKALRARAVREHIVSPYLIEPSLWTDGVYLIGYSETRPGITTFKVERIEDAYLKLDRFELPDQFDEEELLRFAWGIWSSEAEPELVRLKFAPGAASRMLLESKWHPTENVTIQPDGSLIWEAQVAEWHEMLPWVRGWGADVEVLGPFGMRDMMRKEVMRYTDVYRISKQSDNDLIAHWRKRDKQAQSLRDHLTETSHLAERFAAVVGLREVGKILGLVHDLGKTSDDYQNYLRTNEGLINPDEDGYSTARRGEIDHSTAGAQLIFQKLVNRGQQGRYLAQIMALALAAHHSGLIDCLTPDGQNNFQRRIDKFDDDTHLAEATKKMPDIVQQVDGILLLPIENGFFEKLTRMKEENDSKSTLLFKYGLLARLLLSCLLDADRLSTADFEFPENLVLRNYGKYYPWSVLIERLEHKFDEYDHVSMVMQKNSRAYEVNQLRAQVAQACLDFSGKPKGIYQLTVPTGGGKTMASLRFALHHARVHTNDEEIIERIFYIVPYTTIIDQNADEVRKILEDKDEIGHFTENVVLEHHSNLTPEEETGRHNLLAQNWDAPIIFTTQVQFLEALFGDGTRNARRMHQLTNSIVILDEVQTIPIKITNMFITALRFLVHDCGATVVLCTATQPPFEKMDNPYRTLKIESRQHIIQNEQELFEKLKRVEVHDERKPDGWSDPEIAVLAERALQEKGSVLLVVNTRASARALYEEIVILQIAETYHLSTNMCPAHRLDVLKKVKAKLEANEPVICISTQLIEAGVDIDFGAVIRALAGLDSIAQSAGRCNRHGKREGMGIEWVVNLANENLNRLPDVKAGREKTQTVLDNFNEDAGQYGNDRIGLNAVSEYYRLYFHLNQNELDFPVGPNSVIGRNDDLYNLLSLNILSLESYQSSHQTRLDMFLRQSFRSAGKAFHVIDSITRGVVVPYKEGETLIADLCAASELHQQFALLRQAQRYSVNLFLHEFEKLSEIGAIKEVQSGTGVYYLDEQYYTDEFGWSVDPVGNMRTLFA